LKIVIRPSAEMTVAVSDPRQFETLHQVEVTTMLEKPAGWIWCNFLTHFGAKAVDFIKWPP